MVERHENFAFMAAGNTTGAGADMKFVGRNQLDGATLDRFVFVFWEYDEDFEVHVAGEDQREWTFYVQKCRRAAAACGGSENVVFATPTTPTEEQSERSARSVQGNRHWSLHQLWLPIRRSPSSLQRRTNDLSWLRLHRMCFPVVSTVARAAKRSTSTTNVSSDHRCLPD